uniref:Uncharacterized protein n=1 Tax=Anopheles coluzzii TaxID=1518534 RepID=A0A8W7P2B0_ANOCL
LFEHAQDSFQKQLELAQQRHQQIAQERQRLQALLPHQRLPPSPSVAAGKLVGQQQQQQTRMAAFPPGVGGSAAKPLNTSSIIRNVLPARIGPTIIHAESIAGRTGTTSASPLVPQHVVKNSCVPTTPRIVNITTPQEIKFEAAPTIKTVSSGSTMYSVLYAESGNKFTIKRKPDTVSAAATAAKSVHGGAQQQQQQTTTTTKLATMSPL